MTVFFFTAMVLAMIAVFGVLVIGLISMIKGGPFNEKYGNRLMRLRVILQGVALAFFALAFLAQS